MRFIIAALVIALAVLVLVAHHFWRSATNDITVLISDGLTVEAVRKRGDCPVDVPDFAQNVRYAYHIARNPYGPDGFVECVRFDGPFDKCTEFAHGLVKRQIDGDAAEATIACKTIPEAWTEQIASETSAPPLEAQWFEVDKIKEGVFLGEEGSHKPSVWIDKTRGTFFFYMSD